jgi:hypothetical protein
MDQTIEQQDPEKARVLMQDTGEVLDLTNEELQLYGKFHNVIGAARRLGLAVADKLNPGEQSQKNSISSIYESLDGILTAPDDATLEVHMHKETEGEQQHIWVNEVILSNPAQPNRTIRINPESKSVTLRQGSRTLSVAFIEDRDYMKNVGKVQAFDDKGPTGDTSLLDQAKTGVQNFNDHLSELKLVGGQQVPPTTPSVTTSV